MNSKTPHSPVPCSLFPVPSARRGSALLIVLGMLSFMVISAVSFAMFMRQSRVPSSYLRRSASSRYLLKAALANAISRLDGQLATCREIGNDELGESAENGYCEGVYDDPYPGVGALPNGGNQNNDVSANARNGDYWDHRVFTPFGGISPDETVSTLTLEGLAYLPPAVINEARIFSRRTRTAKWRHLSYDSGRYAFCAIDVSDCFDLNRVCAGERRFSAPGERVNLSSLFPDNGGSLDTILRKCSNYWEAEAASGGGNGAGSKIPFTSLADFNIVAGSSPFAPFYRYVNSSGNGIYNSGDENSVANALFITDTWFPPTNTVGAVKRIDISKTDDDNCQPFPEYPRPSPSFMEIDHSGELYQLLMKNIGGCGLACLYDYLDRDRVPISLALPTTEAAPMICGLGLGFDGEMTPKVADSVVGGGAITYPWTENGNNYQIARTISQSVFQGFPGCKIMLSGVVAYPFKHINAVPRKGSFKVETLAAVFFATGDLKARVAGADLRPTADDWTQNLHVRNGVIWCKGQSQVEPSFTDNIKTTDEALKQFVHQIDISGNVNLPIYCKISEVDATPAPPPGTPPPPPPTLVNITTTDSTRSGGSGPFTVFDANGNVSATWRNLYYPAGYKASLITAPAQIAAARTSGQDQNPVTLSDATKYRPYVAVWARVVDSSSESSAFKKNSSNGTVVDLVPATCDDDETYHAGCTYPDKGEVYKMGGSGIPLLDFRGDHEFEYTENGFAQQLGNGSAVQFPDWNTLYAVDPRFNFAPEDWFGTSSGTDGDASPAQWKALVNPLLGTNGRDPDIFMFTSDQEQLQSIGELAFLPRVQEMTGSASFFEGEFMGSARYHGRNDFNARNPGALGNFANGWCMWQTYTAIDHGDGWDPIYSMTKGGQRYEVTSGTGDFRVNPFSPDNRVLMAALKDTPADYFYACDNEEPTLNPTAALAPSDRKNWAFCENSSIGAELKDLELEDLADAMHAKFLEYARAKCIFVNWEYVYDHLLNWYDKDNRRGDEQKTLFNIEEDLEKPLHGVDRKFLYSFWRECFQNRQQLFLVFLRAEPLTVGGMGEGSLASAQLGARGVALVWRDPAPPPRGGVESRPPRTNLTRPEQWKNYHDNYGPHRTRVLFYHQFD